MRTDELYVQKKDEPSPVNQLLSQIQKLQDKVNALNEEKEFYDPETASSSGMSHVPSQFSRIPSPRGMLSRDSGLPLDTRNSMGTSGNIFGNLPAQERMSQLLPSDPKNLASSYCEGVPGIAVRQGEGLRREPQSSTKPTPRFTTNHDTWNPMHRTGRTYSQNCLMEVPRYAISELHFGKFADPK